MSAVKRSLEAGPANAAAFAEADAWLRAQADTKPSRVLHRGSAWGALHRELLRRRNASATDLCPGCDFGDLETALASDPAAAPWASLLANGTFGAAARLAPVVVQSFMVDDAWVRLMAAALDAGTAPAR